MPIPLLLAALPALFKAGEGLSQLGTKVKRADTVTPAEREQLASLRNRANSALPGLGVYRNQLASGQAATLANAGRVSASGADLLAAGAAADAQRQRGELQLGLQGDQYRDKSTQQLNEGLQRLAAHEKADTDAANQTKAAVKSAGLNNLYGGISDLASVGVAGTTAGGPSGLGNAIGNLTPNNVSLNPASYGSYRYPQQLTNPFPYGYPTR